MIKNLRFLRHISINKSHYLALFGAFLIIILVPLATAQAASPPLAAGAVTFPGLGEMWAMIQPRLVVLLILTVFDFLFGVILSLIGKDFKWEYLLHYLNTDILPILAWLAVFVICQIPAEFVPGGALPIFEYGVYATVFLSIAASLFEHFKTIGILTGRVNSEPPA